MKGLLDCEFVEHNLDEVTNFFRSKEMGLLKNDEPIPPFRFATPQNVEDGCYWFTIDGWEFTNCSLEVSGWTENTICICYSYFIRKI